jgi:hypothetical protein
MTNITPTVGRVVYYYPSDSEVKNENMFRYSEQPFDAHILYVWSDICVNLIVFDHAGYMHRRHSVAINIDDGRYPRAEWMPYQKGQAAKTDKAESDIEEIRKMASAGKPLI